METKVTINGKHPFDCTKDEISAAWQELRNAFDVLSRRAALNFRPGMCVYFNSKRGMRVEGVVLKVNSKSVSIKQRDAAVTWKVAPSLLTIMDQKDVIR